MFGNKKGKQKKASSQNRKAHIKQQKTGGYPGYQCFKGTDGRVYCSRRKFDSHSEGTQWVRRVLEQYRSQGHNLGVDGRPYVRHSQPRGAVIE